MPELGSEMRREVRILGRKFKRQKAMVESQVQEGRKGDDGESKKKEKEKEKKGKMCDRE